MTVLGFVGAEPAETGRPGYDPRDLLKLYVYGNLQQVQSSWRDGQRPAIALFFAGSVSSAELTRLTQEADIFPEPAARTFPKGQ